MLEINKKIGTLLTDVVMPGMNGLELGERVRAVRPDTKILYMSGHVDASNVQASFRVGGAVFLQKPFTFAALMQKVGAVLERSSGSGLERADHAIE